MMLMDFEQLSNCNSAKFLDSEYIVVLNSWAKLNLAIILIIIPDKFLFISSLFRPHGDGQFQSESLKGEMMLLNTSFLFC